MKVALVTLGRNGDVLNSLPIAWFLFRAGHQVTFIISAPWASLLDGVSYCDRLIFKGEYSQPMQAKQWAESLHRFDAVLVPQCYGQSHDFHCSSYAEEMWRLVGMREMWGKIPLVFDRRNPEREQALIPTTEKPILLLSMDGISSPFHDKTALLDLLKPFQAKYEVVDLSTIKAERFYDLLGLYEKAAALVAVDSGPLHLAQAVPTLPTIALITHGPTMWHGSPERPNHILRIRYNEFMQRRQEIADVLFNPIKPIIPRVIDPPRTKLIHVWSDYPRTDPGAIRRFRMAALTWANEMGRDWRHRCLLDNEFTRNARTMVGDKKTVPLVGDLIDIGSRGFDDRDIIVLTNDDTCVPRGLTEALKSAVANHGSVYGSRREHRRIDAPLSHEQMMAGYKHVGADVFAFSVKWWKDNRHDMPDMFLSYEQWDLVLKKLIIITGGVEVDGLCYHEIHNPDWVKNRDCPAGAHNRKQGFAWFHKKGLKWE